MRDASPDGGDGEPSDGGFDVSGCDASSRPGCPCNFSGEETGVCADAKVGEDGTCREPSDYEEMESSCDGADNDCDGVTDEGCDCNINGKTVGVCSQGTRTEEGACTHPSYSGTENGSEACDDNVDNDCDGEVDCNDDDCKVLGLC